MTPPRSDLVSATFRDPQSVADFSLQDWDLLVRQARSAGLLARLHLEFETHGLYRIVPAFAAWHFRAAYTVSEKQRIAVQWEIRKLREALGDFDFPLLLLKGAAYVALNAPAARGRLFSDIDILVPRDQLAAAEAALMLAGWNPVPLSAYDQRYYRTWMHEIPPMQHVHRGSVLDVHHAILPDTADTSPDTQKLWAAAEPLPDWPGVAVLSPVDRVLHAATHLFHDGELPHGLRDLSDLDLTLRAASLDDAFWQALIPRAVELELVQSLYLALRYVRLFFDTPLPERLDAELAPHAPGMLKRITLDALFKRALAPTHPTCADRLTPLARFAVYARAHALRMPMKLLIPHLWRKATQRFHNDDPAMAAP